MKMAMAFRWIYFYCHSGKSTGKETGKTQLCALFEYNKMTMISNYIYVNHRELYSSSLLVNAIQGSGNKDVVNKTKRLSF